MFVDDKIKNVACLILNTNIHIHTYKPKLYVLKEFFILTLYK